MGRTGDDTQGREPLLARRLVVHGRVQGVFFRASTQALAQRSGVRGWVANRADGTVEAWLEGEPAAVDRLEAWIRDGGPEHAEVTSVDAREVPPAGHPGFDIRAG